MPTITPKTTAKPATIDKVIFGLLVVFTASLTNSIFINQIGYYGALFFLLVKWAKEKESPFGKNGLEFYFAAFLAVEFISAVLSVNSPQAFGNLFKRLLLIPVVYVISAVAINPKRVSKLFFTFLYFSIISSLLYLWNSYSFYLRGLFQLTGSGPFLFHYPITTSELFSFTALILFPFVIKGGLQFKKRTLYSAAFLITVLSLIATFKRTGWIGFAAGLIMIIILKRKYVYLIPFLIAVLFLAFTQKSYSALEIFELSGALKSVGKVETLGQVQSVDNIDGKILVSDYNAGILELNNGELRKRIKFDVPVVKIKKWRNNYYAVQLVDTRFVLLGKNNGGEFVRLEEFMTKGMTKDFGVYGNKLFVIDVDSGLTVFSNPADLSERKEMPELKDYYGIVFFDNRVILISKSRGAIAYKLNKLDGMGTLLAENSSKVISVKSLNEKMFVQTSDRLYLYTDSLKNREIFDSSLNKITGIFERNGKIYALLLGGDLSVLKFNNHKVETKRVYSFGYNPKSLALKGDTLIAAHSKSSRLSSIFDPYLPANANRVALWRAGIKMFLDNPVFGVGDIDLAELYKLYKRPSDKEIQGHLHNNYFHFLAILGGAGFIIIIFLLVKIFVLLLTTVRRFKTDTFEHTLALGFVGVYISFLVAGLTEWNFGDHEIITFVWFTVGMALSLKKIKIDS